MTLLGTILCLCLSIMAAGLQGASGEGLKEGDFNSTVHRSTTNNTDWGQDTMAGSVVRLTKRTSVCGGVVEIRHRGQSLPLCQESLVEITASILCRKLDCGSGVRGMRTKEASYEFLTSWNGTESFTAASPTPIPSAAYFWRLHCIHPESSLENCSLSQEPCQSERPAEVNCTAGQGVRLVGGPSQCAGRVELQDPASGSWGTVCDDSWDLSEGHVVCRQLGCGSAVYAVRQAHYGMGDGPIHLDELDCLGSEPSLWHCTAHRTTDCGHKEDAGVFCSDSYKLVPTLPVTEDLSSTKTSSTTTVTGLLMPGNDDAASRQSRSLLILCIFLALMLLATLLGCSFIIIRLRRKHRMTSQEPRVPSLMRQGAPVLLSHQVSTLPTTIAVADTNLYQDSLNITPKPQVSASGPSPAPRKDSDSDYEDYDFSTKPPMALASFYNSLRSRPIDGRHPQDMAQMEMLREGAGTNTPPTLTENLREVPDAAPREGFQKRDDTLSISSEEDHGTSSARIQNSTKTFPYQTSRKAPPAPPKASSARTNLPSSGRPVLRNPDSCCVELEKDPELERAKTRNSVASRLTHLKHNAQGADDSSSTSSGEDDWYQNWKPPPQTSQHGNARPFAGDSDAAECSNWL